MSFPQMAFGGLRNRRLAISSSNLIIPSISLTVSGDAVKDAVSDLVVSQPRFAGTISESKSSISNLVIQPEILSGPVSTIKVGNSELVVPAVSFAKTAPVFVDPFAANVVLHLKGDGADNGTVFTDSSQYNHTVTRNSSNIVTSTAQSKYGGSSLYSPTNTANTCLTITNNPVFNIGTQDFTIEFWYYKTGSSFIGGVNATELFTLDGLDFPLGIYDGAYTNNKPTLAWGSNSAWTNDNFPVTSSAVPLNQWIHICFCRQGGFMRAFYNGALFASVADTSTIASAVSNPTLMGSNSGGYGSMLGFMDNFRFTMAGRYTASFNPETDTYLN